ncbi:MAG: type II secretion system F family protein [Acidimicrobiia bacterium]
MGATVALAIAARRAPTLDRVRRLRTRSGLPLPGAVRDGLSAALARADVDVTPDDAVKLWLLAALVGAGLAGALSPLASLPFGIAVLAGGPLALWWARGRGDGRVVQALPGALDRVSAGLRAGATVGESLTDLADGASPLAPDLRRLDARAQLGVGLGDALAQWSRERPLPGVQAVTGALALAVSVGGACAGALEGLGESLRAREAMIREAHALSAQTRMSAFVVGGAPVAYLVFVSLADPGSIDVLLATFGGRACLAAGLVLEGLAALWMRALLGRTA